MFFKNAKIYKIAGKDIFNKDYLEDAFSKRALQKCMQMEMQSRGWVVPRDENENFVHASGQQLLIALGVEKKLLPASVINQHAKTRIAEIEQLQGYKPGKKQVKDIKEAAMIELLPRAFVQCHKTYAWIDGIKNRLIIDTASTNKADEFVEVLLKSVNDLVLEPIDTQISSVSAMTRWLSGDDLPSVFTIDRDCELQSTSDEKETIRYTHHVLKAEETYRHIRKGKRVIKLAMTYDSKVSFVLQDNLQLRRITPLGILKESTGTDEELFDSDFAIMTGEYSRLIDSLIDALM